MSEPSSTQPVFTTTRDLPDNVDTFDICAAAEKAAGRGSVLGAQRIGALWRLNPREQLTCRRCLGSGHKTENCKNEEVCLTCKRPGHRKADGLCEGILDGKQRENGTSDKMGDGPLEDRKKFIEENGTEKEREDGEVGSEVEEEEVERIDGVDTSECEMENVLEKRQSGVKAVDYLRRGPSKINTEEEREEGEVASEVEGEEARRVLSNIMSSKEIEDKDISNSEEENSDDDTHNGGATQKKEGSKVKIALKKRTLERRLDTYKTAEKQKEREKSGEKKDQDNQKEKLTVMKRNENKKYAEGKTVGAKPEDR
ncbi:hypothetical protein ElyMa_002903800, partial [Elysia marginata]